MFSEDFVQDELREREFTIDGEIENEIAVDSDSIKLKDAQAALSRAQVKEQTALTALDDKLEKEKLEKLSKKASINKRLKEYSALSFGGVRERYSDKPRFSRLEFRRYPKEPS